MFAFALNDGATEAHILELVNQYRFAHGQEALTLESSLCRAADGHAKFMASNHVLSHYERSDMLDYSGANLSQRAEKVGWKDTLSELVGYANTNLEDSVQAVFDSPCHRARFLKPGKLQLGASAQGQFVCLLIGGDAAAKVVVSPAPEQTDVPTSWHAADDLSGTKTGPGSKLMGYPVILCDGTLGESSFSVVDATLETKDGQSLNVLVRTPNNDQHFEDALALIPEKPLPAETTITAHVTIKHHNGTKVERVWQFTTRKADS